MKNKIMIIVSSIIFIISIWYINLYNVLAIEWGSIGANSTDEYLSCGSTYNGCIGVYAYRYTIIKNIKISDTNFTYDVVPGTKSYVKKENLNAYYTSDQRANEIMRGGTLFEEIIQNTNATMSDFFDNDYYIMIEVEHAVYYSTSGSRGSFKNDNILHGYTSETAKALLDGTPISLSSLTGLQSVTKEIPCSAYIPYSGSSSDSYCIAAANKDYKTNYLTIARDNPRFGKRLVHANDITEPTGTLKITKKNNLGANVSGAGFTVYSGSNCDINNEIGQYFTNARGEKSIDLSLGNYSLKETKKASNYYEDPDDTCINFTITSGTTVTKSFTNTLTCQYYLDEIKNNYTGEERKKQLIKLYEGTYNEKQGNYSSYKKLLDFNNPECSSTVSCSYSNDSSCLYTSKGVESTFSENNLSCYNETEKIGTFNLYCLTSFTFDNKLNGVKNFTGISGQIIRELSENDVLATATLKKTCYGFGISSSETPSVNYSNYVENIKFNQKNLINDYSGGDVSLVKSGNKYESTISVNYSLPPVYVKKGTGEIVDSPCNTCISLGNVFLSKFTYNKNELTNDKIILPFSINFKKSIFSNVNVKEESNSCTFTPNYELIEDDKLQLEFRTIDTTNPFSGKYGDTRTVGANWCDETGNCSGDLSNAYVEMLINSNNSYNTSKEGAKYVIELTVEDIQSIREYNKTNSYDDYDFYCINDGETCISNYLTELRASGIITTMINDNRACIENNEC